MKKIKISVVTVVYNGEKYLEETIQSVLNQTYPNIEYIIIDGGSTDGTVDIIKKYEDKIDYWISEPDRGIYDAMNKGIRIASGEYIGILNADDWYEVDTLERVVYAISNNRDIDIFYGLIRFIKDNKEFRIECQNHNFIFDKMIPHPTCFIKKDTYKKLNYYDISYKVASDYDFLIRAKISNYKFYQITEVLTNFRIGGISSSTKIGAIESLKIKRKYKLIDYRHYILKVIFFKLRSYITI
jgi:glycosyltransferase involved in cell wall biosynthesis